jgi:pyrroloquinoline-quinone synthase
LAFFKVHEQADVVHSQKTKSAIAQLATADDREQVLDWTQQAVDALNLLLDGVYTHYCQS